MSLVHSLLTALVRAEGRALLMQEGERACVVGARTVELSSKPLAADAAEGLLRLLLPPASLAQLDRTGTAQHALPGTAEHPGPFVVSATRGARGVRIEIRRGSSAPTRRSEPDPRTADPPRWSTASEVDVREMPRPGSLTLSFEDSSAAALQSSGPAQVIDASRSTALESRGGAPGPLSRVRTAAARHKTAAAAAVVALGLGLAGTSGLLPLFESEEAASLRLPGLVSATEVTVAAKVDGRLEDVLVEEGTWVEPGDTLAVLDSEELGAERRRQAARVEQLSAQVAQAAATLRLEEDRTSAEAFGAQARLDAALDERERASVELSQLQQDASRALDLFQDALVSRQDVERAETAARAAEAGLRAIDERIAAARAELRLAHANTRYVEVARQQRAERLAELEQARAQLAQAETRLAYTRVTSPLHGMVSTRAAQEGEVVRAGSTILTIVDLDDVWVRANVEERDVGRVVVGQQVAVETASGSRVQGTVTFVSPEPEFATQRDVSRERRDIRTFAIKVDIPNPERRLHPGMSAFVWIDSSGQDDSTAASLTQPTGR